MEILFESLKFVVSLGALTFFAERLIHSGVKLARAFGISPSVIGLTLLAYGTSLPEFSVSTIAAIKGHSDISVANIVGSNIYNIAIVMGIASLLRPISIKDNRFAKRDGPFMLLTTSLLIPLAYLGGIGRVAGVIMVATLALYTYYLLKHDRVYEDTPPVGDISKGREMGRTGLFLAGVLISGDFTVDSAVTLARLAGVAEWVIGATIVAAGTSLPETVVSIIAARKGEMGMSVGNIVGSNIFNILWILGFASLLNPLTIDLNSIYTDLTFLCAISILFHIGLVKGRLSRWEGGLYITIYAGYIYYLIGPSIH
ncbi:MAG: calcium/sodium antiporter [Deltaproteobacteria bacterium]|nr:calcium/sodium antiporter [Deltaproteobacteria bacterium]